MERTNLMTCINCVHYKPLSEQVTDLGSCRRNPPTIVYFTEEDETSTAFPMVSSDTYCGEFVNQWEFANTYGEFADDTD